MTQPSLFLLYIDFFTGSLFLQVLLGGLLTAVITLRLWWSRFTGFLRVIRVPRFRSRHHENK